VGISPRTREGGSAISIIFGLFMICLSMLGAVGGLVLVQRLVSTERRQQHNDVAGFIYAVLGVAYAVLLGLTLIAVWEEWEAAQVTADDEASEVAEVFWTAHATPTPGAPHPGARSLLRTGSGQRGVAAYAARQGEPEGVGPPRRDEKQYPGA